MCFQVYYFLLSALACVSGSFALLNSDVIYVLVLSFCSRSEKHKTVLLKICVDLLFHIENLKGINKSFNKQSIQPCMHISQSTATDLSVSL